MPTAGDRWYVFFIGRIYALSRIVTLQTLYAGLERVQAINTIYATLESYGILGPVFGPQLWDDRGSAGDVVQ